MISGSDDPACDVLRLAAMRTVIVQKPPTGYRLLKVRDVQPRAAALSRLVMGRAPSRQPGRAAPPARGPSHSGRTPWYCREHTIPGGRLTDERWTGVGSSAG